MTVAEVKRVPNEKQRKCIDNPEGKFLLVLAGPGTGKTFTIIERIKKLLSKGVPSEKILCLTYTDAAANEMKKRIEDDLGIVSCNVQIYTYHGFCCNIIDEFDDEFEIPSNHKVISDPVSKAFIKECIEIINPVYYRTEKNDPYYYIDTIKNQIRAIKQNRINKESFFKNLKENDDWEPEIKRLEEKIKDIKEGRNKKCKTIPDDEKEKAIKKVEKAKELWKFFDEYTNMMREKNYIDFEDMINLVLDKYDKNPSFFHDIANRYEYIMVDEYQDTNKSQNDIIFALTKSLDTGNIFVVGDDEQIIYRFQGAKLDTIQNFINEFNPEIICLEENMRSTQSIIDAAKAVIRQNPLPLKDENDEPIDKVLTAKNEEVIKKDKPVRFCTYFNDMIESTEIVKEIDELINSEDCPKDKKTGEKALYEIAILSRSNDELETYAQLLKQRNIPYELKEGKDIFTIPAVNVLYFYILTLVDPRMYSYRLFELLLSKPFNINPKDYQILHNEISKYDSFIDAMKAIPKEKFYKRENCTETEDYTEIEDFIKTYDYLNEYKTTETIINSILKIGAMTGIFDYYLNNDINRTENIAGIKRFIDEAVGFSEIYQTSSLEIFCDYLKAILRDEEKIKTEKAPVTLNAVQLCTYHSSKGREFEYVYMPALNTYKWESSNKSLKPNIPLDKSEYKDIKELRECIKPSDLTKLMYVSMTRAKHTLRMSYAQQVNGKNRQLTKFLANIQDMFEKALNQTEIDENSYWEHASKLLNTTEYDYKKDFAEFINVKLQKKHFSPSSVNLYLACPRKYFYQEILEFEVRDGNPNFSSYGIAVHKACEEAVRYIKDKNTPPEKSQFIKWFKDELANRPMESKKQRENFIGRGEKALDKYYCQIVNTTSTNLVDVEYKFEYVLEDGTTFTGIIDRIDKNENGYTIYDYKTGNNKNKDIGIGKAHEDYYNQMGWYKYFYEKATGNKVSVTKFLYPEEFEKDNNPIVYTEEEIEALVEKFKTAVSNIRNYEFSPSHNEDACQYCNYRDFCDMNRI